MRELEEGVEIKFPEWQKVKHCLEWSETEEMRYRTLGTKDFMEEFAREFDNIYKPHNFCYKWWGLSSP